MNRQGNQACIKYFVSNNSTFIRSKYVNGSSNYFSFSFCSSFKQLRRIVGSMKPIGQVYSDQSIWSIQHGNEVRRPSKDAYISFYSKSTNKEVHRINVRTNLNDVVFPKNKLIFFTSIEWKLVRFVFIHVCDYNYLLG